MEKKGLAKHFNQFQLQMKQNLNFKSQEECFFIGEE